MANTNELDYSRKVADGERLEIIMRQVASRFKLDGNVLAEALLDIHERLKAVEGATEELTSSDRWKAFKTVQLVKPSPSAAGDTVTAIDTVAQDENGEVTATKKNIRQGTTSQTGIVQLSDATNSTSTALAATANAVKTAYDLASTKITKVSGATEGNFPVFDANGEVVDSGITAALVAKIHEHANKAVLDGITATDVSNWNGKMSKQTAGNASTPIYLDNGTAKACGTLTGYVLSSRAYAGDSQGIFKILSISTVSSNRSGVIVPWIGNSENYPHQGELHICSTYGTLANWKDASYNLFYSNVDSASRHQFYLAEGTDTIDIYVVMPRYAIFARSPTTTVAGVTYVNKRVTELPEGAVKLTDRVNASLLAWSVGSASTPVYFENGVAKEAADVSGKADKVTGATEGDVATLDANGNLVDSGKTLGTSVPADAAFTDDKVAQMKADSSDTAYPLLMAGTADPSGRKTVVRYDSGVTLNPSTNIITANISGNASTADLATSTSSGAISANADLNDLNTANRNYQCKATNASTISNKPSGASGAFELEVIRGTGDTCVQVYYSRDDVNFNYIRKRTGNDAWTSWVKMFRDEWVSFTPDTLQTTEAAKIFAIGNIEVGYYFDNGANFRLSMRSTSGKRYVYLADQHGNGGGYALTTGWTGITLYGFTNSNQLESLKGYDTTGRVNLEFDVYFANGANASFPMVAQYRVNP